MGDKADKPKKKTPKRKAAEKGVMSALPSTRPERIGTRRQAVKTPPAPKPRAAAKRKPAGVTSGRPKAAAPRTFEPTRAAEAAAGESRPEPGRGEAGGLVGSALHVAGGVAQAGLSLGGRFVKGAVGRLPRP